MKNMLIALLLFAAVSTNAQTSASEVQTDSVEVQIIQLPDSTVVGTLTGKKLRREIGAAGVKIASEDGRVELIFPADALDKATEISNRSVTNLIVNGNKSYQFEPPGTRFSLCASLTFVLLSHIFLFATFKKQIQ